MTNAIVASKMRGSHSRLNEALTLILPADIWEKLGCDWDDVPIQETVELARLCHDKVEQQERLARPRPASERGREKVGFGDRGGISRNNTNSVGNFSTTIRPNLLGKRPANRPEASMEYPLQTTGMGGRYGGEGAMMGPCIFCNKGRHPLHECRNVTTVSERVARLNEDNRCFACGKVGHSNRMCHTACGECGKLGHMRATCHAYMNRMRGESQSSSHKAKWQSEDYGKGYNYGMGQGGRSPPGSRRESVSPVSAAGGLAAEPAAYKIMTAAAASRTAAVLI